MNTLDRVPSAGALAGLPDDVQAFVNAGKAENTKRGYRPRLGRLPHLVHPACPARAACGAGHGSRLPRAPGRQRKDGGDHRSPCRRDPLCPLPRRRRVTNQLPIVTATLAGIRRQLGTAPKAKAPLMTVDLRRMVDALPASLLGLRDRALLLVGFAGAFRRSELVALTLADVRECAEGSAGDGAPRSKTDQEGEGQVKGIPYGRNESACPVRALRAWLEAAGVKDGPLFRSVSRHGRVGGGLSDRDVARAVKKAAAAAGIDPALFSGHSLRSGLATSAAAAGVSERIIMQQTGHKSERMVRRYIRDGNLFRENAAAAVL